MKRHMQKKIIYLIIILCVSGLVFGFINPIERKALKVLYDKTGGNNWLHQENWGKAFGTEPTWHGITCDAGNTTVLKIELPGNNLNGELPKDMEDLSSLEVLDLSNNKLRGQIPLWLEKFKNLKKLDLSHNDFSGKIPPQIGNLKNLEELILEDNRLEGSIPEELGNLSNLKVLRIGSNRLTGEIPRGLMKLKYLKDNESNFKWNGLYSENSDLKEFLKKKQEGLDWESTQTIPPIDIQVIGVTESTITIGWKPVPYVDDNGEYRVFCRREGQPYENKPTISTANKRIYKVTLKYLEKSTRYYLKIYTWTESHAMNKNKVESLSSEEQLVSTGVIIFSGTVRRDEKDGKGVPGVQLTAFNGGGSVETDKDGKYWFVLPPGWTGVVTPFKEGFKFDPAFMSINTPIIEDKRDNDFTMKCDTVISGRVTYKGKVVGGVILRFSDDVGKAHTEITDGSGYYRKEVPYGWSGSVAPEKAGHRFIPVGKKYDKVISSLGEQNYEVQFPKISGRVKRPWGKGIGGVKMEFSNINTTKLPYLEDFAVTDEEGNYEKDVPENWLGKVEIKTFIKSKYLYYLPKARKIIKFDDTQKKINFKVFRFYKYFLMINYSYVFSSDYSSIELGFRPRQKYNILRLFNYFFCEYGYNTTNTVLYNDKGQYFSLGLAGAYIFPPTYVDLALKLGISKFKGKFGITFGVYLILAPADQWFIGFPLQVYCFKELTFFKGGFGFGVRF